METFENWIAYKIINKEPIKRIGYDHDMPKQQKERKFFKKIFE